MSATSGALRSQDFVTANLVGEAANLCAAIGRGNANGPLLQRLEQFKQEFAAADVKTAAIPLTGSAVQALLGTLFEGGKPVDVGSEASLLQLRCSPRGRFGLVTGPAERHDFADAAAFKEALRSVLSGRVSAGRRLRLEAPSEAGWGNADIALHVIGDDDAMTEHLVLSSANEEVTRVLVVAPENHQLTEAQRAVLRDLLSISPWFAPCVLPAEGGSKPLRPWWDDASLKRGSRVDGPVDVGSAITPVASDDAIVRAVFSRRLQPILDALQLAHAQESRRVRALRAREDRVARSLDVRVGTGGDRSDADELHAILETAFGELEGQLEEQNRRALLPKGSINKALADQLETLGGADLDKTESYSEVKVTLSAVFVTRVLEAVKREIRNQFKDDLYQVKTRVEDCRAKLVTKISQITGTTPSVTVAMLDESDLWRKIRDAVTLEISYRGTLPKRGVLQRLSEGKQFVFTGLSLIGLVGMVFGLTRKDFAAYLAVGLPVLFVAGVGMTYRTWQGEDSARIDKELERIRDQVSSEVKRLIGEAQREKQQRLKEAIDGMRRELLKRTDAIIRDHQARRTEQLTRGRNEAREKLRALEALSREMQSLSAPLSKLRQSCSEAVRAAADQLRAQAPPVS